MTTKIGKPIEPMLVAESGANEAKFAEVIKKHKGKTLAEIKYDGYRLQVHKDQDKHISLFTKNLNPLNPRVFPEILPIIEQLPPGIYDSEIAGFGTSLEQYNAIKKRVRNDLDIQLVNQYPLQLMIFDILKFENKDLIKKPLYERRKILEEYVEQITKQETINTDSQLKERFDSVVGKGLEGLVCKNPNSLYLPGGRTKDWIKLKNFITLDLVVLGIYKGEGKSSELPFAALLLGTENDGKYETIAKVGLQNKEMVQQIYSQIRPAILKKTPPELVLSPEIAKKTYARKVPQAYVSPQHSVVVEVKLLNITRSENWHSCGLKDDRAYSLRIASIERLRTDKKVKDCNTTQQVMEMYSP